jgi:copper chaperone
MSTLNLSIEGMHCGGCVQRVTDALRKLPGVAPEKVEVGHATIRLEENQTPQTVIAALERIGFEAKQNP